MPEEILSLTDIWKSYGDGDFILKALSIIIGQGQFVGIHGRSGSGKSTLLRLMGLLDRPTRGKVTVLGKDATLLRDSESAKVRREKLGFIFQGFNLIPHITALENIEVPMWLVGVKGQERKERAMADLRHFGLENLANRYPKELSHGEQQRVAAIRALVNRPRIILADEPTSSLDDENAKVFLDLVSRFNGELGTVVVMTTTDPDEAKVGSHVYKLSNGSLALDG